MSYPAAELQKALYDTIIVNAALKAAMGGEARAYDIVPAEPEFPYITIGQAQLLDEGDTCEDNRFEALCDLQVWSRDTDNVGQVECKRVSGALRDALLAGLTMDAAWLVKVHDHRSTDHFMDPDGITARARLSFRFLIEPA